MNVQLVTKTIGVGKYEGLTSEEIISAIARHGVIKEDNGKLVKYLMDNKHWSPLDMINFSFEIETSRAIGRQLLRHASIRPQEHSQRYSDRVLFEPIELRKEDVVNRQSSTEIFDPEVWYRNLETKVVKELDFAWATEPIEKLNSCTIYHNAGVTGKYMNDIPYFYKGAYHTGQNPLLDEHLETVINNEQSKKYCTWYYTNKLLELKNKYNINY